MTTSDQPVHWCLFGASPDTGNLGVSALCYSVICGLAQRLPSAAVTVFDEGRGARSDTLSFGTNTFAFQRFGAWYSRRLHRPESMWNMRVSGWLGGGWNAGTRAIRNADAVLDISGGDSFTDLYGSRRFQSVVLSKRLAIEQRVPLILLPQTYGPFQTRNTRRIAKDLIVRAGAAWARDQRSFSYLQDLLGGDFDPARHHAGVDVAFRLHAAPPAELPASVRPWLECRSSGIVGINVSGLIYNDPKEASARYGLKANYRELIISLLRRLLTRTDRSILLIPHVFAPSGHFESDLDACRSAFDEVNDLAQGRVMVMGANYSASEAKGVIAQLEWFCGTRMHATIAALSSGVPSAAVAYSNKTAGVFETCRQGDHVADPREFGTSEMLERLWWSWEQRAEARLVLHAALPEVLFKADAQMDKIAAIISARSAARRGAA